MVIVALDFENYQKVEEFLNLFETPIYVKVGMELFYQEGIEVIKAIKTKGHKVFLDLKLHHLPMHLLILIFLSHLQYIVFY